ncbi:cation:proton antiporter [Pleomorphomonas oryzae]|uniref:cation:proton antiporter n=1 Tax=Pleomorphomonas oryzae TaxID=261934 RepID=UPI000425E346|nr:sodium:proton antiporter [Pleomorphomonas oryzae]
MTHEGPGISPALFSPTSATEAALSLFQVFALLVVTTAAFGWLNRRFIGLPEHIALLLMGLGAAVMLVLVEWAVPSLWPVAAVEAMLRQIDFGETLLQGVLAFLLFAAAITVDWEELKQRSLAIALLATIGVVLSAVLVATMLWAIAQLTGLPISFAWCLVFGALIAPTDPIAVSAALEHLSLPDRLRIDVTGESLFNDGVGVVLFALALSMATGDGDASIATAGLHMLIEIAGALLLGVITATIAVRAFRQIDDYSVEVLISLALAMGGYALADTLGVSGPITVVASGVLVGNLGAPRVMSQRSRAYFYGFWRLIDDLLNALLFVLLGLEVLVLHLQTAPFLFGLIAVPVVLIARAATVAATLATLGSWLRFDRGAGVILTWAAVRGAISAALALSIPYGAERELILAATYAVILFSSIVQGLTLERVIRRTTTSSSANTTPTTKVDVEPPPVQK